MRASIGTRFKRRAVSFILQIFRRKWPGVKTSLILACSACLLRLAFPGDVPFLGDEALLLDRALADNAAGVLTTHGLTGSRGTDYGPVPILFYRALLGLSHDPLALVLLKTALVSALTLLAVFSVLRQCPTLPSWTALFVFFSPYFWFYSRDLWDNTLNFPLTALAFAAYLEFQQFHRRRYLALTFLFMTLALLVHLLALPLCLAILLHLLWRDQQWIRDHRAFCLGTVLVCAGLSAPYLAHLIGVSKPPVPIPPGPGMLHVVFGALGGRLFTGVGFEYFLGPYWYLRAPAMGLGLGALAMATSGLGFLFTFRGMGQVFRQMRGGSAPAAAWVAGATIGLHLALVCVQQLINHPHYYGSVWIAFYYCLGLGVASLRPAWNRAAAVSAGALVVCLFWVIAAAHGGVGATQAHYGTKLLHMAELARNRCAASLTADSSPVGTLQRLICP